MFSLSDQHACQGNDSVQQILVFSSPKMKSRFEKEMGILFQKAMDGYTEDFQQEFLKQNPTVIENELSDSNAGAIYKLKAIKKFNGNWIPCIRCGFTGELLWEGQPLVTIEGAMFVCKNQLTELINGERNVAPTVDTVDLIGVKNGVETLLGKTPMPPLMKAKELDIGMFGGFTPDDGSDADLCYASMCDLLDWMQEQAALIENSKQ